MLSALDGLVPMIVLTVHAHQSAAHLLDSFLVPECFDIEMLHKLRLNRFVHIGGSWHPISVRTCCS